MLLKTPIGTSLLFLVFASSAICIAQQSTPHKFSSKQAEESLATFTNSVIALRKKQDSGKEASSQLYKDEFNKLRNAFVEKLQISLDAAIKSGDIVAVLEVRDAVSYFKKLTHQRQVNPRRRTKVKVADTESLSTFNWSVHALQEKQGSAERASAKLFKGELNKLREALIEKLQASLDTETKAGNLDAASEIRAAVSHYRKLAHQSPSRRDLEEMKASTPDEIPPSWSLEEIAKATPPYGVEAPVYVLAWSVKEDERPLRVESCLVMKVLEEDDDYGRWCLAHLYRHPGGKNPEWQLSMIHVSGAKGTIYYPGMWIHSFMRFKDKPGNKELYAALPTEKVRWSFEREKDWEFESRGVCEKNWLKAIGEKPTRYFGK